MAVRKLLAQTILFAMLLITVAPFTMAEEVVSLIRATNNYNKPILITAGSSVVLDTSGFVYKDFSGKIVVPKCIRLEHTNPKGAVVRTIGNGAQVDTVYPPGVVRRGYLIPWKVGITRNVLNAESLLPDSPNVPRFAGFKRGEQWSLGIVKDIYYDKAKRPSGWLGVWSAPISVK